MAWRHKVPRHVIDGHMKYVPEDDDAWDNERLKREEQEWKKAKKIWGQHPVQAYRVGQTRYNLDDERVREYLDFEKNPVIFRFRRPTLKEASRMQGLRGFELYGALIDQCLLSVEGLDLDMDGDMKEQIYDISRSLFEELGSVIGLGALDLTEPEKKA